MKTTNVKIIPYGTLDEEICKSFESIKSNLFTKIDYCPYPIDHPTGNASIYPAKILEKLKDVKEPEDTLTIIFSEFPIADGYIANYSCNNKHIVSLYDAKIIIEGTHFKIKNYIEIMIIKSILCFCTKETKNLSHSDIRGCIFDLYTKDKNDLIAVLNKPHICDGCCTNIEEKNKGTLSKDFLKNFNNELKKLKPSLFLRLKAWVKEHIIISLLLAGFASLVINLLSSFIWEFLIMRHLVN